MYKHYHDIQVDEAFTIFSPEKCVLTGDLTPGVEVLEDGTLSTPNPDWKIVTGYPENMEDNGVLKPEVLLTQDFMKALRDDTNMETVFAITAVHDIEAMDILGFVVVQKK